ncbi:MAG: hypothetical protein U1E65_02440 [Myxococcota bacterium]
MSTSNFMWPSLGGGAWGGAPSPITNLLGAVLSGDRSQLMAALQPLASMDPGALNQMMAGMNPDDQRVIQGMVNQFRGQQPGFDPSRIAANNAIAGKYKGKSIHKGLNALVPTVNNAIQGKGPPAGKQDLLNYFKTNKDGHTFTKDEFNALKEVVEKNPGAFDANFMRGYEALKQATANGTKDVRGKHAMKALSKQVHAAVDAGSPSTDSYTPSPNYQRVDLAGLYAQPGQYAPADPLWDAQMARQLMSMPIRV